MARQNLIVQVFVASPVDVTEERATLETVILQLNQIWSRTLGLTFELLKWDTTVRPAFASDPQAVINSQIASDYDVLMGIFWGRIGTETPRGASGTVEEFDRAYARLQDHGTSPEIMLYFKDAPIAPSKLDPKQLEGVQQFKRVVSSKGGLYSEFEDLAGFESSVRAHLSAVAQKFAAAGVATPAFAVEAAAEAVGARVEDNDEDFGYIDYVEIYDAKVAEMTTALEVINQATVRIGEQATQHAAEFQTAGSQDVKAARRFVKRAADDMNSYAEIMRTQVAALSSARVIAFGAMSNALSLRSDFVGGESDLRGLRDTLVSMDQGATTAKNGMAGMRGAADGLPRIK